MKLENIGFYTLEDYRAMNNLAILLYYFRDNYYKYCNFKYPYCEVICKSTAKNEKRYLNEVKMY